MKPTDILEALDEFDARYLECYHQLTSKPRLLEWPSMNQLSSPLLSPQSDSVTVSKNNSTNSVPRAHMEFEDSVTFTAILLANATPTYLTLESDNYHSVDIRADSPNVQYHKQVPPSQFGKFFNQPLEHETLFTPLDQALLQPCSSVGHSAPLNKETLAHPLRMNRLLLTLMLAAKLNTRRSKDRRSTVTTYVGNPFYRRRNLQGGKSYEEPDAV